MIIIIKAVSRVIDVEINRSILFSCNTLHSHFHLRGLYAKHLLRTELIISSSLFWFSFVNNSLNLSAGQGHRSPQAASERGAPFRLLTRQYREHIESFLRPSENTFGIEFRVIFIITYHPLLFLRLVLLKCVIDIYNRILITEYHVLLQIEIYADL